MIGRPATRREMVPEAYSGPLLNHRVGVQARYIEVLFLSTISLLLLYESDLSAH